jgi:hypothetical protein
VNIQTTLVVNERCVSQTMRLNPVTNVLSKLDVAGFGTVQLVGEGAKKAIAIASCVSRVEAKLAELFRELLGVGIWVGKELVMRG